MQIDKLIETPEGVVRFQGTLDPVEVEFIVEFGLNELMKRGALPFTSKGVEDSNLILPGVYTEQ